MTEVATQREHGHAPVSLLQRLERLRRPVVRSVVHVEEAKVVRERVHHAANLRVDFLDHARLVEDRDDKVNFIFALFRRHWDDSTA